MHAIRPADATVETPETSTAAIESRVQKAGPIELDMETLKKVGGGAPRGTWIDPEDVQAPRGTW